MPPKNRLQPTHPGEILADELAELGISPDELDRLLAVPSGTVAAIVAKRCGITAEFALRLARYLGSGERLWMNLQISYDLKVAQIKHGPTIASQITPLPPNPIAGEPQPGPEPRLESTPAD